MAMIDPNADPGSASNTQQTVPAQQAPPEPPQSTSQVKTESYIAPPPSRLATTTPPTSSTPTAPSSPTTPANPNSSSSPWETITYEAWPPKGTCGFKLNGIYYGGCIDQVTGSYVPSAAEETAAREGDPAALLPPPQPGTYQVPTGFAQHMGAGLDPKQAAVTVADTAAYISSGVASVDWRIAGYQMLGDGTWVYTSNVPLSTIVNGSNFSGSGLTDAQWTQIKNEALANGYMPGYGLAATHGQLTPQSSAMAVQAYYDLQNPYSHPMSGEPQHGGGSAPNHQTASGSSAQGTNQYGAAGTANPADSAFSVGATSDTAGSTDKSGTHINGGNLDNPSGGLPGPSDILAADYTKNTDGLKSSLSNDA